MAELGMIVSVNVGFSVIGCFYIECSFLHGNI